MKSKSHDVSKAIDKAAGAEREVVGTSSRHSGRAFDEAKGWNANGLADVDVPVTAPATPEAEQWEGWGTALKPSHEPIVVARKPLAGTVAANVLAHGTGALNIDATRVGYGSGEVDFDRKQRQQHSEGAIEGAFGAAALVGREIDTYKPAGRWPANVVLDEEAAVMLDEQTEGAIHGAGAARPGSSDPRPGKTDCAWQGPQVQDPGRMHRFGDKGGASRFFFVAQRDTMEGCEPAPTAAESSSQDEPPVGSVPSDVPTSASLAATPSSASTEPITSATPSESKTSAGSGTPRTPSSDCEPSRGSPHIRRTPSSNPASAAETGGPTGTTTTTPGPSTSDGSAEAATSSDTPSSTDRGALDSQLPIDSGGERFRYVAKASRSERGKGNDHPTVKPVALMEWLVRLVCPPEGLVLDPFAGSGSTGIAATREGMSFIGLEREAGYVDIARRRIRDDSPLINGAAEKAGAA